MIGPLLSGLYEGGSSNKISYIPVYGVFKLVVIGNSVSDPNSFDTDPDPAFLAEFLSGSRVLMTKLKKIYS
jgi:hypothetical protein